MAIKYTSSYDQTIAFSDTCRQFTLTANNAISFTVPGNANQKFNLLFGLASDINLFVGYNVAAAIPAPNTMTTTQGIEFITPDSKRYVKGGDVISLISPDATAYVGVSIRSIPN